MSRLDRERASTSLSLKIFFPIVVWWTTRLWRGEHWLITYVGYCLIPLCYALLVAWSDWARTERSRDRRRGLVCLYVGHSLPEPTHAWTTGDAASIEHLHCRRCGRAFEVPHRCGSCGMVTNEEETE